MQTSSHSYPPSAHASYQGHIIPDQVLLPTIASKYDASVISELTFDTYHKHIYQSTSNQITHSMQTVPRGNSNTNNRLLALAMTNNYRQNSLNHDEEIDALGTPGIASEQENVGDDSMDDNASCSDGPGGSGNGNASFHRKKKSLLKQLSKKFIKPPLNKLSEGFDGIASPFRPKKGNNTSNTSDDCNGVPEQGIIRQRSSSAPPAESGGFMGDGNKSVEKPRRTSKPNGLFTGFLGSVSRDVNDPPPSANKATKFGDDGIAAAEGVDHDGIDVFDEVGAQNYCIRIQVEANSRYKICTTNPTGMEDQDCWATVTGTFFQSFYIVGDGSGLLGIADRLVTIEVDQCRLSNR